MYIQQDLHFYSLLPGTSQHANLYPEQNCVPCFGPEFKKCILVNFNSTMLFCLVLLHCCFLSFSISFLFCKYIYPQQSNNIYHIFSKIYYLLYFSFSNVSVLSVFRILQCFVQKLCKATSYHTYHLCELEVLLASHLHAVLHRYIDYTEFLKAISYN